MPDGFAFGPFVLDPAAGLYRDGQSVLLGGRALALLGVLAETPGEAVTKATLLERGWPGTIVEEGNLTVQVAALRKALGVRPDGGDYVVTVPRVGYRLVAPAPARPARDAPLPERPALAVLPFLNLGGDSARDWFVDGVVEDMITALSRFKSFAVIARNSSFTYKGRSVDVRLVANELGVRYVLEGSLRRVGDRLRITAQLVDCEAGAHLWAERFDGAVEDVFDFQDLITDGVATIVGSQIEVAEIRRSRIERPGSIAVYDILLKAQAARSFTSTEDENNEALALLMQALELEPDNALILAPTAWALSRRSAFGQQETAEGDRARSIEFARRGLAGAGEDAVALAYCGYALLHGREYDLAMAAFQTAVEANPNNLLAVIAAGVGNLHCGDVADALAFFRRAERLSPRDQLAHVALTGIAHAQIVLGDHEGALASAGRSLAFNPNYVPTHWMLIASAAHLGLMDQARHRLEALMRIVPEASLARIRAGQPDKDPARIEPVLEGLRLAGMDEGQAPAA